MIVSLVNFTPTARFDGIPWAKAYIQEAPQKSGPWVTLSTIVLAPVDADPRNPAPRNFTVPGTIDNGWYRVVFATATDSEQTGSYPTQNGINYSPSVEQVGTILRARTKDSAGNELGTFTDDTKPTYNQVAEMIGQSISTLRLKIGEKISPSLTDEAARLAAIRAAMLIELSFFPDQVQTGHSPYNSFKELWEEGYGDGGRKAGTLVQAIISAEKNQDSIVATNPGMAAFSFPVADNLYGRRM
jgi:hypothetical protein